MKNKAVHRTPDLDPSVVEKILARHAGELSDPVVYRPDRPLESKVAKGRPPHIRRSETHKCVVCGACGPTENASETSERFEQLSFEAADIGGDGNG
jgi:hypothetical protein